MMLFRYDLKMRLKTRINVPKTIFYHWFNTLGVPLTRTTTQQEQLGSLHQFLPHGSKGLKIVFSHSYFGTYSNSFNVF